MLCRIRRMPPHAIAMGDLPPLSETGTVLFILYMVLREIVIPMFRKGGGDAVASGIGPIAMMHHDSFEALEIRILDRMNGKYISRLEWTPRVEGIEDDIQRLRDRAHKMAGEVQECMIKTGTFKQ